MSILAVDPDYHGQGIGRQLLNTAAEQAQGRGYRRLSLHVAATNARALRLYQGVGFSREVTFHPPYQGPMGIPAFISMWRRLP